MRGSGWFISDKKKNPFGYRVDISNPEVAEMYVDYRKLHGIPYGDPLGHKERLEFEKIVFELYFTVNKAELDKTVGGKAG